MRNYNGEDLSILSDMLDRNGYGFIRDRFCWDIRKWDLRDAYAWDMQDILITSFEDLPLLVGQHRTEFDNLIISWRLRVGK